MGGDPRNPGRKIKKGKPAGKAAPRRSYRASDLYGQQEFHPSGASERWRRIVPQSYPTHQQGSWGTYAPTWATHWLRASLAGEGRGTSDCHSLSSTHWGFPGTGGRLQAELQIQQLEVQPRTGSEDLAETARALTVPAIGDRAAVSKA